MRPSRWRTEEPSSRIECSTSACSTTQPSPTARVGPDVGVADDGAGADHRRAADGRALQHRARLDDHAAVDLGVDQLAVDAALDRLEDEPVGLEHVVEPAGVLPPAAHDVRLDVCGPRRPATGSRR